MTWLNLAGLTGLHTFYRRCIRSVSGHGKWMPRKRSGIRFVPGGQHTFLEQRLALSTLPAGFSEVTLATGLKSPTAMAVAPDGRTFVAEQNGTIRVVGKRGLVATPFAKVDTNVRGERGLTGIALDPNFPKNGFVYVYYNALQDGVEHARVSRLRAAGNIAASRSERVVIDLPPSSPERANHFGGALQFGKDGTMYIGVGDDGDGANAQSLATPFGKLLRINSNGSIPANNPFSRTTTGVNRAIWATGLRNPFTIAVAPGSGRIFINDVGLSSWEEINFGQAGANYGWPDSEGPTTASGVSSPVFAYPHGTGETHGFGIIGGVLYNPARPRMPRKYLGQYFFADLANGWIRTFNPKTSAATTFATGLPSLIVDVDLNARGIAYLSRGTGAETGEIHQIAYIPVKTANATKSQRLRI